MPIHSCTTKGRKGYKWGRAGKCYASRQAAQRQAQAIHASGYTGNVFCPTGPGGGVDPTCSPKGGASLPKSWNDSIRALDKLPKDREHAVTIDAKTGEVLRRESGEPAPDWTSGEVASVKPPNDLTSEGYQIIHIHTHMDVESSFSDGDWGFFASQKVSAMTVIDSKNIYTLTKPREYIEAEKSRYTSREFREAWDETLARIEGADTRGDKSAGQLIHEVNQSMAKQFGFGYVGVSKSSLVGNRLASNARKAPNPLRADPTRTLALRRQFMAELNRRLRLLQRDLHQLIVVEDAFGLRLRPQTIAEVLQNVFCATGEGGGVDPSCSPSGGTGWHAETKGGFVGGVPSVEVGSDFDIFGKGFYFGTKEYASQYGDPKPYDLKGKFASQKQWVEALAKHSKKQMDKQRKAARENLRDQGYAGVWTGEVGVVWEQSAIVANTRFAFHTTPQKVEAFRKWLKRKMAAYLVAEEMADMEDFWWQKYIQQGYLKGAGRAFEDTKKAKMRWAPHEGDFYKGTKEQFLRSSFGQPEAIGKVKLLAGRTYTDLKGITDSMSTKLVRGLTDGLVQGMNPLRIAATLDNAIEGIDRSRAETIARTEIIRAHAEGQLQALEEMGIEDVGVMVEWNTTGDEKVCELCVPLEGTVLKIEEAHNLLPRHPNCRCAWIPANVGEDTGDQTRGKKAVDSAIDDSIEAEIPESSDRELEEQKERTSWPGADADIAKTRPQSILNLDPAANVFCPTGPGGGVDPSCSSGGGSGPTWDYADELPAHDSWKSLEADPGYLYHATSKENAGDIQGDYLRPHKPSYGTDQQEWPDGSITKRSYFIDNPSSAWMFAPENGKPALLRIKKSASFKVESGTKDYYLEGKKVPPHALEILTKSGWKPLKPRPTSNVFCPTGKGGGVDPTCSPGGGAAALGDHLDKTLESITKYTGYSKQQLATSLHSDPVMRSKVTGSILLGNNHVPNAVLHVTKLGDPAHIRTITEGDATEPLKQFADTPAYDLAVLTKVTQHDYALQNEAVTNLGARTIKAGTSTRPGSYRHELGHVLRGALGGKSYDSKTAATKAIAKEYEKVQERVKADPSGLHKKLTHEEYESKYGVAGRRSLDNWEENFAEHYRLYHREIYRDKHEGGGGKFLAGYRQRHPGMARILDAHYTTALLSERLQNG